MITLTVDRSSLGLLPLTINDAGTGTYVLVALDAGTRVRDNAIAASRWLDGGQLVSSRVDLVSLSLSVRVNASTVPTILSAADALDAALGQFGYTITQAVAGAITPTTYTCLPASTSFAYDPVQLRAGTGVLTASIPVQP